MTQFPCKQCGYEGFVTMPDGYLCRLCWLELRRKPDDPELEWEKENRKNEESDRKIYGQ